MDTKVWGGREKGVWRGGEVGRKVEATGEKGKVAFKNKTGIGKRCTHKATSIHGREKRGGSCPWGETKSAKKYGPIL